MNRTTIDRLRTEALEDFLAGRTRAGYRIETQTATQAIIVRRSRMRILLGRLHAGNAEDRLVVSVDNDGQISTVAAEPRRW
jgi:hypothetical protein